MIDPAVRAAMAKAIAQATEQHPHPNPRVGAVILAPDGSELGSGAHAGPGTPHAERLAIADAGDIGDRATLVVTLEPCNHTGRTPPCTDAIIEAGIERVVIGALDPDVKVDGSGARRLRDHGIEVEVVPSDSELGRAAREMDPGYFHHRRFGTPLVIVKLAATLDGQTAAADGSSRWITGPEMRLRVHEWRARSDAVLVGAGTLIADDPSLDVRIPGHAGHQPRPVVVAGTRPLPANARIWRRNPIVVSAYPVELPTGELIVVQGSDSGVDLVEAMDRLGDLGLLTIFVEGGGSIASSLMARDRVDVGLLHFGAKFGLGVGTPLFTGSFATIDDARPVDVVSAQIFGGDVEIRWDRHRE